MNTYYILEANMERLQKKLKTIENKCKKYNVEFTFNEIGHEFREKTTDDGYTFIQKYIIVEAEGVVSHNDWIFAATIEHKSSGNVIRQFATELEVPERYRTSECVCEHCNTNRRRKDTFLVYNPVTDEWKQVGKSCLKEFTDGLSAEDVARYISYFDELIKGEAPYGGSFSGMYYSTKEVLAYTSECVQHFGYFNSESHRSTRCRMFDYYNLHRGFWHIHKAEKEAFEEEMDEVGFDAECKRAQDEVEAALNWIRNISEEERNNTYMHNLYVVASDDFVTSRDVGILVSLIITYRRHIEREAEYKRIKSERDAQHELEMKSNHVGQVKDRIQFIATHVTCVSARDTMYGPSYLFKMLDENGNVFMWSTSNWIEYEVEEGQEPKTFSVVGTVKEHSEFNGIKQTFLTRCKVTEM